ncbi:methylase [Paenibacillus elgii]|uniref:Methylase n=1 Tax=Paenibacillus elgii TaxID=189691 RepID=A0A161S942_9BACL|nr:class I SAM-dependent methyltransferase [Paenibacillus elgii]KZE76225.1 methylase [Paenibacillus elgii]
MDRDRSVKARVQEQFGKHAEKYVASEGHAQGDDLEVMLQWLDPRPEWQVLDIATGGGHAAGKLSPYVRHIVATDLTRPMLAAAAAHLTGRGCDNILYTVADAEQLPFLDAAFDAVTCRIAAHHFPNPALFMQEAARVLKPGGRFVFIDNVAPEDDALAAFMNRFEAMRDPSHVLCLSVREWKALAEASGLRVVQEQMGRKRHAFPSWVRRTADTEEQARQVEQFILGGPASSREYFSVQADEGADGALQSLQIDDWRVLLEKPAQP